MSDLRQHKDLLDAGYAPGNYTFTCIDCEQEAIGDKRARRCLPCAEKRVVSKSTEALTSNPRALIEELVGYVTMTSDRIGFSRVLQKIEAQLARTPSRLDAEKVFGTMSMRARQRTSRENVGDVLAAMSEMFSGEPSSAPETCDVLSNFGSPQRMKNEGSLEMPTGPVPGQLGENSAQILPSSDPSPSEEFNRGAREGWMRALCYYLDTDAESRQEFIDGMERRWPLGSPLKASECQHDRFKPGFTLEWLGSTPQLKANTHRFMCKVCRETFDLAIGEAQLSQNGEDDHA